MERAFGSSIHRMNPTSTGIKEMGNGGLMVLMETEFGLLVDPRMLLLPMDGAALAPDRQSQLLWL